MPKRRHRSKPEQSQEELVAEQRRRCRGPEWWDRYSREELEQMLREKGAAFIEWSDLTGER